MTKPNPSQAIHLVGAVLLLALLAGSFTLTLRPRLAQQRHWLTQAAQERDLEQRVRRLSASATGRQQQLIQLERDLAACRLQLRPDTAANAQIARLTQMLTRHGLEIEQVQPGLSDHRQHAVAVPIRLTGQGGYPQTARLLAALHREFPATAVQAWKLWADPAQPQAPARFQMNLLWHASPHVETSP